METTYRPLYCLNNYRNIHQTYSMFNTGFYGLFNVPFLNIFFSHNMHYTYFLCLHYGTNWNWCIIFYPFYWHNSCICKLNKHTSLIHICIHSIYLCTLLHQFLVNNLLNVNKTWNPVHRIHFGYSRDGVSTFLFNITYIFNFVYRFA